MDQSQLDALYQQYLGRGVDPSGLSSWGNADYQTVVNGILGSQEYAQRQASNGVSAPAGVAPQDLASQVFNAYKTNENYDQALNQLNATPQNADYYRARIGLIGQMMGWQTGQNTGDRNTVYQQELASYLPGAKAAGLTDAEINSLISQNSATASQQNQQRIAQEAAQGQGWVNQNIPGGWGTVGALTAAIAAPYVLPEIFGAGAAVEGAGAIGQALPYTEAFDAANLYANGITNASQLGDILASTGMDSFLAADMGNLAAQGLSAEQIAQVLGYSYTPAELAGTGIQSFAPGAASSLLSGTSLANLLKGGSSLVGAAKSLGLTGGSTNGVNLTGSTGINPNTLANALKGLTNANQPQVGSNFGLAKGNVNPFAYTKDVPTQTLATNKADPFAALNVPQTPIQPYNPLAHLVG